MLEQLEEARVLWRNIKKRTGVVAGYIQQNLPFQVYIQCFRPCFKLYSAQRGLLM